MAWCSPPAMFTARSARPSAISRAASSEPPQTSALASCIPSKIGLSSVPSPCAGSSPCTRRRADRLQVRRDVDPVQLGVRRGSGSRRLDPRRARRARGPAAIVRSSRTGLSGWSGRDVGEELRRPTPPRLAGSGDEPSGEVSAAGTGRHGALPVATGPARVREPLRPRSRVQRGGPWRDGARVLQGEDDGGALTPDRSTRRRGTARVAGSGRGSARPPVRPPRRRGRRPVRRSAPPSRPAAANGRPRRRARSPGALRAPGTCPARVHRLDLPAVARPRPRVEQHPAAGRSARRRRRRPASRRAARRRRPVPGVRRRGDRQARRAHARNPPSSTATGPPAARPSAAATTPARRPRPCRRRRRPPGRRGHPGRRSTSCRAAGSGSGCRPPSPGGAASSVSRSTNTAPGTCPASWSARPGGPPRRQRTSSTTGRAARAPSSRRRAGGSASNGAVNAGRGGHGGHPARRARRHRPDRPVPWVVTKGPV